MFLNFFKGTRKLDFNHFTHFLAPHFSQKVRSPTPEALQNLGFDWVIAL
jgi:hypothetical protein